MIKKFGMMVLCVALAFGATACSGNKKNTAETTADKTNTTTSVDTTTTENKELNPLISVGDCRFADYICETGISEYSIDLNHDGTDEQIKIDYYADEDYEDSYFKIFIGDNEMIEKNAYSVSMIFVDIDPTDSSSEIVLCEGCVGSKRFVSVYKYVDNKLVGLNDSMYKLPCIVASSYGDGKLVLEADEYAAQIGCFRRKVIFEYQNGELVESATDNIYAVSDLDYSEYLEGSTKYNYKAAKEIQLYKDATCKVKAGTIKKNDIVTINRVMVSETTPCDDYYTSAVEIKSNGEIVGWMELGEYGDSPNDAFVDYPEYD